MGLKKSVGLKNHNIDFIISVGVMTKDSVMWGLFKEFFHAQSGIVNLV